MSFLWVLIGKERRMLMLTGMSGGRVMPYIAEYSFLNKTGLLKRKVKTAALCFWLTVHMAASQNRFVTEF